MKKITFVIGLIFVSLICYAQEKKLNSAYTELVEWNGAGEDNSKPFALEIEKESFEKFLNGRNRDTTLNRKFTAAELIQAVKNNEDIFYNGPCEYNKTRVIERGNYIFLEQFSTGIERNYVYRVGDYIGRLISEDEVITYRFSEKKNNKEIFKDLKTYMYFDSNKNRYIWLDNEAPAKFAKAIQAKYESLPLYIRIFQNEWEKIIGEYIFEK